MTNEEFLEKMATAARTGAVPRHSELTWLSIDHYEDMRMGTEEWFNRTRGLITLRHAYIREFGYSIPCAEAVELLMRYGPILEVGAGTGFWSAIMAANDIDVICTNPRKREYAFENGSLFEAEDLTAKKAQEKYSDRNIFCSWPCYQGSWLNAAILQMKGGQHLILIGEGEGGCTGNDRLFDILREDFDPVEELPIPQFNGMHDYLAVYRRRGHVPSRKIRRYHSEGGSPADGDL